MFGFLKDKLKGWMKKAVPEKEKELVKAPKEKKKKKEVKDKKNKKIIAGVSEELEQELEKPLEKERKKEALIKKEKKEAAKQKENLEKQLSIEEPGKNLQAQDLIDEKNEEKEKKLSFLKIKSFLGFKKKKEEDLLEKVEKSAYQIEEERKTTEKIWKDIEKDEKKFEEEKEEREEKSIMSFFRKKFTQEKFDELFPELEMILLQSNVALKVVDEIRKKLQEELVDKTVSNEDIRKKLKKIIESLLLEPPNFIDKIKTHLKESSPFIISFVGINGSGKTTSIAKVAHLLKKEKISVCVAAADTFRSAAIEQLSQHASRLEIPIIKKDYGADPASVGFDAITYAKKHKIDVVLIDTAGRMQTKDSLMTEMEKIMRVCKPNMKLFVGESITGNDATEQAAAFNESILLDGIILSKADVDEKGGTSISVSFVTGKPIFFLGTGQAYEDLEVFKKEKIIKSLGL